MQQEEAQIIDSEDYRGSQDQQYSHEVLVMIAKRRCLESGAKEMRAGYFNTRTDMSGNIIRTYIEDTRKAFIESVETLEMIIDCDFDKEAKDNIKKIKENLDESFKELCKKEFKDWKIIPISIRNERWKNRIYYSQGSLNTNLKFYQEFIEEEVKLYREIFKELNKLVSRIGFYQSEKFQEGAGK